MHTEIYIYKCLAFVVQYIYAPCIPTFEEFAKRCVRTWGFCLLSKFVQHLLLLSAVLTFNHIWHLCMNSTSQPKLSHHIRVIPYSSSTSIKKQHGCIEDLTPPLKKKLKYFMKGKNYIFFFQFKKRMEGICKKEFKKLLKDHQVC